MIEINDITNIIVNSIKCINGAIYLVSFFDVIFICIIRPSHRNILSHRVAARYGVHLSNWKFARCFIENFYRELNYQRISTELNRRSMRQIFWANMKFSLAFPSVCQAPATSSGVAISCWNHFIADAKMSIDLQINTRQALEEGDFRLVLHYENIALNRISFSLAPGQLFQAGENHIMIVGGNQGCSAELAQLQATASRQFHDILAGDVLVLSLIGIARAISCPVIVCVGLKNHSRNQVYSTFWKESPEIRNLYDALWLSYDASKIGHYYSIRAGYNPTEKDLPKGRNKGRKLRKRGLKNDLICTAQHSFEQIWSTAAKSRTNQSSL